MDLQLLGALLEQRLKSGGSITLDTNDAQLPPELRAFLAGAPGAAIALTPTPDKGIVVSASSLTVTGTGGGPWRVPDMPNCTVTADRVTLTVTDGVPPAFVLSQTGLLALDAGASVAVRVTSPASTGQPWLILLDEDAKAITPSALLRLSLTGQSPLAVPPALDVLDRVVRIAKDRFGIAFVAGVSPAHKCWFQVSIPDAKWEPVPALLAFDGLDANVVQTRTTVGAEIVGHISIGGTPVDVSVSWGSQEVWVASVRPAEGAKFPGLADFVGWIGDSAAGSVAQRLKDIGLDVGIFDATIQAAVMRFDWQAAALRSLSIAGTLRLASIELAVSVELPDLQVSGSLKKPVSMDVRGLLASFDLDSEAVPADFTIDRLQFDASPTLGWYQLAGEVDGVWDVGPLKIAQIRGGIVRTGGDDDGGTRGSFGGTVAFAGKVLELAAEYVDKQTGWRFAGRTIADTSIPIGALADELARLFQIKLPAAVVDLDIRDVGLMLETGSGHCAVSLEAVTSIGDAPVALTVRADLLPEKPMSPGAPSTWQATFGGTLDVAGLVFDLELDRRSDGDTSFVAFYRRQDDDPAKIDLRGLIGQIVPPLRALVPSVDIELSAVKLAFVADENSVHGGRKLALGIDLGAFDLSVLPVVGALAPAGGAAIETMQIVYGSAAFTAEEIGRLNALIAAAPHPVAPLPAMGFAKGPAFAADVRVGAEAMHVALGLPPAENTQPPAGTRLALAAAGEQQASAGTAQWFTVGKSLGPISLRRLGVEYQDGALFVLLDASLAFGGLAIGLDGIGFGSPLSHFAPTPHLDGLSVAFAAGPVSLSGGLLAAPPPSPDVTEDYIGAVAVSIEPYVIGGVAAYAKVAGQPSFFAFAEIEGPLGGPPAFFVTGLMAAFGYNSQLALPAPDQVHNFPLVAGLTDKAVMGPDPTPLGVMNVLSAGNMPWVTPARGEDWLAAGIMFRSFELVFGHALVVARFGAEFDVAVLGLANMSLPQGATTDAYAYVELQLEASLKPQEGSFSAIASLTSNSFLLTRDCHLTGGFAFCLWFGDNPHDGDFVVTAGGYHPAFVVPPWYPQVAPVGFNWPVSGDVTVKGAAYFALTPTAAMAGGGLQVLFQSGDLKAWFCAYANMMVRWKPFYFTADIGISIGASYRLNLLFTSVTLSVELGATLDMWGPPTGGVVHIHWVIISFSVGFGADPVDASAMILDWTGFKSLLPNRSSATTPRLAMARADDGAMLLDVTINRGLMRRDDAGVWYVRADELVFTTESAVPATSLVAHESEIGLPDGTPKAISIRPMGQKGISSVHKVSLRNLTEAQDVDLTAWPGCVARTRNLPEALWGEPLPDDASPAPGSNTVLGLATGIEIAAPPAQAGKALGPIDPAGLIDPLGDGDMPLAPADRADPLPAPVQDDGTIGAMMAAANSSEAWQAQVGAHDSLVAALAALGAAPPSSDPMMKLSANAGSFFSQPPLCAGS